MHTALGDAAKVDERHVAAFLDEIDRRTNGIAVLAASDTPWDIDDAPLRPGRFDRRLAVDLATTADWLLSATNHAPGVRSGTTRGAAPLSRRRPARA